MSDNMVVVGVFADRKQAEQAIDDLRAAHFDHLGFLMREQDHITQVLPAGEGDKHEGGEHGKHTHVVTGGVVGGVVGAAAALLIPGIGPAITGGIVTTMLSGAAVGAAAGGLIGAFVTAGVPEEDARYYEQEIQSGRAIVIVQADENPLEAFRIMERNRAYNAKQRPQTGDREATVELKPLENEQSSGAARQDL